MCIVNRPGTSYSLPECLVDQIECCRMFSGGLIFKYGTLRISINSNPLSMLANENQNITNMISRYKKRCTHYHSNYQSLCSLLFFAKEPCCCLLLPVQDKRVLMPSNMHPIRRNSLACIQLSSLHSSSFILYKKDLLLSH